MRQVVSQFGGDTLLFLGLTVKPMGVARNKYAVEGGRE
jgi:hypothetical protein